VGTFLRRPPPELQIVPLEKDAILRAAARSAAGRAPAPVGRARTPERAPSGAPRLF
jgi:hypothetical protein